MFRFKIFFASSAYLDVHGVERIIQTQRPQIFAKGDREKSFQFKEIYPTFRTFPRIWKTRVVWL